MPTISKFFGIAIRMYYDDHAPPHFHAYYQEHEAKIAINSLELVSGYLPRRALPLVIGLNCINSSYRRTGELQNSGGH